MRIRYCTKCELDKPVNEFVKSPVKRKLCRKCFYKLYVQKPKGVLIKLQNEKFIDIDDKYIASNLGRIFSKPINSIRKDGLDQKRGYLELKQPKNYGGYPTVRLNKKIKTVHKLVALAFVPNLQNKPQINHKDGRKDNNNAVNLEWVTCSENVRHAIKNGLIKIKKVDCYDKNHNFIKTYNSVKDAEVETGVQNPNIYAMMSNKKYPKTAGGFVFKNHGQ